MANLKEQERIPLSPKELAQIVNDGLDGFLALTQEEGLYTLGDAYGVEQFFDDSDMWTTLTEAERQQLLEALSTRLGIDLANPPEASVVDCGREEGVPNTPSEAGGEYIEVATNVPGLTVKITTYEDSKLGTRYDLTSVAQEDSA